VESISILEKTPCVLFIFESKISVFGSSISAIDYSLDHGLDDDNLRFLDDCRVFSIVRVVGFVVVAYARFFSSAGFYSASPFVFGIRFFVS